MQRAPRSTLFPYTTLFRSIRKGKASKPTEFGKMVKIQEAENQIITHYQVFAKRPNDADLLVPAVQKHEEQFGRVPQDRKSTRLNSSHTVISYAVFCLKKKN